MSDYDYLRKLFYLAELLEQGNTGTACVLAKRLVVSRRTVFRYLDELRLYGADIDYCQIKKTYFLKNYFDFKKVFLQGAMKWHT